MAMWPVKNITQLSYSWIRSSFSVITQSWQNVDRSARSRNFSVTVYVIFSFTYLDISSILIHNK